MARSWFKCLPKLSPAVLSSPANAPSAPSVAWTWTSPDSVIFSHLRREGELCTEHWAGWGSHIAHFHITPWRMSHTALSGSRDTMSHAAAAASPLVTQSHKAETNFGTLCALSDSRISKFIFIMGEGCVRGAHHKLAANWFLEKKISEPVAKYNFPHLTSSGYNYHY